MPMGFKMALGVSMMLIAGGCSPTPPADGHTHAADAPGGHAHDGHGHGHAHGGADGEPHPLVHRFEHAEEWAKKFDDPARDAWQHPDDVVAALGLTVGATVADVGAGTGYFEGRLAKAVGPGGSVLAVDVEPDMVRYLGERATREGLTNVKAQLSAMDDPKLPAASVDRVLVVDVWHHVPERPAYAAKLRAALRPGGQIVIVDFKLDAKQGPPRDHRLSPEQIMQDLAAAGLDAKLAPVTLPEQYVVVAKAR